MKKEQIQTTELSTYMDAMNGKGGIVCELKHPNTEHNEPCRIDEIRCKPGVFNGVMVDIDVTLIDQNEKVRDCKPVNVLLYYREFEDGDYVRQQDGRIVICAGLENGKYLFHAALCNDGDIDYPDSEYYLYGSVMPGDRLCTEQEMMKINGALMKQGKIFDIVQNKVVDSVFKQNPGAMGAFLVWWSNNLESRQAYIARRHTGVHQYLRSTHTGVDRDV